MKQSLLARTLVTIKAINPNTLEERTISEGILVDATKTSSTTGWNINHMGFKSIAYEGELQFVD